MTHLGPLYGISGTRWRPLPTTRYTAGGASDRSSKETSQNWEGTSESRSRSSRMNFWDLRRYQIIKDYEFQLNNISWQHLPLDACSLPRPTDLFSRQLPFFIVSTDSREELLQCQRVFLHKCLYNGGKCLLCFSFFRLLFVLTAEYSQTDICWSIPCRFCTKHKVKFSGTLMNTSGGH